MQDLFARQPDFVQELIRHPRYQPTDLGQPLPNSPHAASVCLPRWRDVVAYEEGDATTAARLQTGYPRFFYNRFVRQAIAQAAVDLAWPETDLLLFPTRAVAQRCLEHLRRWGATDADVCPWPAGHVCAVTSRDTGLLKRYWQHAGEGLSSRHAEAVITGHAQPEMTLRAAGEASLTRIRQRLADWLAVPADHVFLYPTGMAAIYAAYRAARALPGHAQRPSAQFGFPYVDALKIQQRLQPQSYRFYPTGDLQQLAADLATQGPLSCLLTEFPSNPLLQCPDLEGLRQLADTHDFPLLIDDTLANALNARILPVADVLTMSLTKYFLGSGDATGGAVILRPEGRFTAALHAHLQTEGEGLIHPADAHVLAERSADLPQRLAAINTSAVKVARFLADHPAVARVYHPSLTPEGFGPWGRDGGGQGGLLSFELKNAAVHAEPFYDALRICKGANLGTSFSLCCPYTLLAHYDELDFVESCGVSRYLLRLSVGLEGAEELIGRLTEALQVIEQPNAAR